jgi:hypothetical protein
MKSNFAALVLANVNPDELGLSNLEQILINPIIRKTIAYSNDAAMTVIGLNNSLNNGVCETIMFENLLVKFLPYTKGALASVGLMLDLIPDDFPIIVVPTNASIEEPLIDFYQEMSAKNAEIGLVTIKSNSQDLSYVRYVNEKIVEIHEKEVVSQFAITGHYYFKNKKIILECLNWAMLNKVNKNGLLYIAPSLNFSITKGMKLSSFMVSHEKYTHTIQSKGGNSNV